MDGPGQGQGGDPGDGGHLGALTTSASTRLLCVLLHQAVDLEPVGATAVSAARLGHPHRETFLEAASLAGGSVPLIDDTDVVVLTVRDHCLVVTESSEERFAALTGEGSEVESSRLFITDPAQLVL